MYVYIRFREGEGSILSKYDIILDTIISKIA